MVRVADLGKSLEFYTEKLGLVEMRRVDTKPAATPSSISPRPGDAPRAKDAQSPLLELTYNWDSEAYTGGRNFGHLAFAVDDIYATCDRLMKAGVSSTGRPRDGHMAFIRSPDAISIELLQKGERKAEAGAVGVDGQYGGLVGLDRRPSLCLPAASPRLAPPARSAFFLDVDGTLLEIGRVRKMSRRTQACGASSRTAAAAAGWALALVSGRKIDDLDRIFVPMILPAAGLHGAEIRFFDGAADLPGSTRWTPRGQICAASRPPSRPACWRIRARRSRCIFGKGRNWRMRSWRCLQPLRQHAGLAVQRGKMVAELKAGRPQQGYGDRGAAGAAPFAGRTPVFIGDDLTDESGFEFVNRAGRRLDSRRRCAETRLRRAFTLSDPASCEGSWRGLRAERAAVRAGQHPKTRRPRRRRLNRRPEVQSVARPDGPAAPPQIQVELDSRAVRRIDRMRLDSIRLAAGDKRNNRGRGARRRAVRRRSLESWRDRGSQRRRRRLRQVIVKRKV